MTIQHDRLHLVRQSAAIVGACSSMSRLVASLRPQTGAHGLDTDWARALNAAIGERRELLSLLVRPDRDPVSDRFLDER